VNGNTYKIQNSGRFHLQDLAFKWYPLRRLKDSSLPEGYILPIQAMGNGRFVFGKRKNSNLFQLKNWNSMQKSRLRYFRFNSKRLFKLTCIVILFLKTLRMKSVLLFFSISPLSQFRLKRPFFDYGTKSWWSPKALSINRLERNFSILGGNGPKAEESFGGGSFRIQNFKLGLVKTGRKSAIWSWRAWARLLQA